MLASSTKICRNHLFECIKAREELWFKIILYTLNLVISENKWNIFLKDSKTKAKE